MSLFAALVFGPRGCTASPSRIKRLNETKQTRRGVFRFLATSRTTSKGCAGPLPGVRTAFCVSRQRISFINAFKVNRYQAAECGVRPFDATRHLERIRRCPPVAYSTVAVNVEDGGSYDSGNENYLFSTLFIFYFPAVRTTHQI